MYFVGSCVKFSVRVMIFFHNLQKKDSFATPTLRVEKSHRVKAVERRFDDTWQIGLGDGSPSAGLCSVIVGKVAMLPPREVLASKISLSFVLTMATRSHLEHFFNGVN